MLYRKEIHRAIDWFLKTQNPENFGWSWVRDISPNLQNTAEVIYCTSHFVNELSDTQKDFINEAAEYWIMFPSMNAAITIDWIWAGMALIEYGRCWDEYWSSKRKRADFDALKSLDLKKIDSALSLCVDNLLSRQNDDGGWADNKGDSSTVIRTSAVLYFFANMEQRTPSVKNAIHKAVNWLLTMQNIDGGWGNIRASELNINDQLYGDDITVDVIDEQIDSNASCSGYAILALASLDRIKYRPHIKKAVEYLNDVYYRDKNYGIFYEVGMRRETVFTYRHFGTVWATLGLLASGDQNLLSNGIVSNIKYILSLQDPLSGGFKCTENSGVYTWSTVNAIDFLHKINLSFDNLSGIDYTDIILDYIKNKSND